MTTDISPKHLEMLLTMLPRLSHVTVLVNPANPSHSAILTSTQAAAQKASIKILPIEARTPQEVETAFSTMIQNSTGAIMVIRDAVFNQQAHQIAELATRNRLPSVAATREYVESGGLMSYGQNIAEGFRNAATYVDKIFKGAKAGELPIEQPTKFHLAINRRTAKALGIAIPQELLLRADEVID